MLVTLGEVTLTPSVDSGVNGFTFVMTPVIGETITPSSDTFSFDPVSSSTDDSYAASAGVGVALFKIIVPPESFGSTS